MIERLEGLFLEFSQELKLRFEVYNEGLKSEDKAQKNKLELLEDLDDDIDEFRPINLDNKLAAQEENKCSPDSLN